MVVADAGGTVWLGGPWWWLEDTFWRTLAPGPYILGSSGYDLGSGMREVDCGMWRVGRLDIITLGTESMGGLLCAGPSPGWLAAGGG